MKVHKKDNIIMRMDKISAKTPYTPSFLKFKDMFLRGKLKLKNLVKDVFEKSKSGVEPSMSEKYPYPRKLPNSFSAPDEVFSKGGGSEISFYPEDIEKMKNMSVKEILKYKEYLIKTGKYIE